MKKIVFTISAILLFSVAAFAQADFEKPIEWKSFVLKNENFSVDAPDALRFYKLGDRNENRRYSGIADGTYFFIFSDDPQYSPQYKTTLKFIEKNQKEELEKQKNSDAMKFKFSDDEKFFHTIYAIKTKNRKYIFHLVSEKENDQNVKRFFMSLKVNEKPASIEFKENLNNINKESGIIIQEPAKVIPENKNPAQSKTDSVTASGQGNGRGTGYGNGSGSGEGVGTENGNNSQSNGNKTYDTKALNITFKPRPKYTDLARFHDIVGSVRTRVTFLSDGTIGSVTPVTRLPFGLTNSAIYTAKEMRFKPQTVNGKTVSVTKVVVFNFTIY